MKQGTFGLMKFMAIMAEAMRGGWKFEGTYKSRGHGGKHSPQRSRPVPRKGVSDRRLDEVGTVGERQAARQLRQGLRMVTHPNGFTTMERRS
jgi:hypothetical protein